MSQRKTVTGDIAFFPVEVTPNRAKSLVLITWKREESRKPVLDARSQH
jgi:hypothetical protein